MPLETRGRWALPAAALLALAGACARKATPAGEATGGGWRPVLLASADAIRLPPPPAEGSEQARQELDELVALGPPAPEQAAAARAWNEGACLRWNEIARNLVAKHRAAHTAASRVYALLGVAQYDALVVAWNNKYFYKRRAPAEISPAIRPALPLAADPAYPSEHAVVAAASAAVLAHLYPDEAAFLAARATDHQRSRLLARASRRSDVEAGDSLGRAVAATVIEHARKDGSNVASPGKGQNGDGDGGWSSARGEQPIDPAWGQVRPWLMSSGAQFRAGPPPAYESEEFRTALAEIRRFSDTRTHEQMRLAAVWADGEGSYAPAGRWNGMAAALIAGRGLNELRAARVFALLNMALMDAGISAWDTKYHYMVKRPSQVDPLITTPVREPNSPSYTCSHAAFSGAGAAVLGHLFPDENARLRARAEEAAMSRLYAGIQFRFEGEAGLTEGRRVAELAIARARADGAP